MIVIPRYGRSYVDWLTWPAAGGLNVLLLSDQELHIVQALTYPRSTALDCAVTPIGDGKVETLGDDDLLDFRAVADDLQVKLTGGVGMDAAALLAAQVAAMTPWTATYTNTALPAGNSTHAWTAVPVGTVRLLRSVYTYVVSTSITALYTRVRLPDVSMFLHFLYSPENTLRYLWTGYIPMVAGDYLHSFVYDATLNDALYVCASGHDLATT